MKNITYKSIKEKIITKGKNKINKWLNGINKMTSKVCSNKKVKKLCLMGGLIASLVGGTNFVLTQQNSAVVPSIKIVNLENNHEDEKTDDLQSVGDENENTEELFSKLDGPIKIGDAIKLNSNATYYKDATLTGEGVSVYNDYVKEDDWNQITAVALVDGDKNILSVSYEQGFVISNMVQIAIELGITNFSIVYHLGPIDGSVMEGANEYRLGWTSNLNMTDATSKIYTKKL